MTPSSVRCSIAMTLPISPSWGSCRRPFRPLTPIRTGPRRIDTGRPRPSGHAAFPVSWLPGHAAFRSRHAPVTPRYGHAPRRLRDAELVALGVEHHDVVEVWLSGV